MSRYFQKPQDVKKGTALDPTQISKMIDNTFESVASGSNVSLNRLGGNMVIRSQVNVRKGAGFDILERVAHLPAIDPNMSKFWYRKVFWCSYETGLEEGFDDADGNDGVWTLAFPQHRWYPDQNYSSNTGIPVDV